MVQLCCPWVKVCLLHVQNILGQAEGGGADGWEETQWRPDKGNKSNIKRSFLSLVAPHLPAALTKLWGKQQKRTDPESHPEPLRRFWSVSGGADVVTFAVRQRMKWPKESRTRTWRTSIRGKKVLVVFWVSGTRDVPGLDPKVQLHVQMMSNVI